MAYPKVLNAHNKENQNRAIYAYSKFLDLILSKIDELGLAEVLKLDDTKHPNYWVLKHYRRILDFAEQVQLKTIPQKVEGDLTHTVVMDEIKKEDKPLRFNIGDLITQDTGHTGQAPSCN